MGVPLSFLSYVSRDLGSGVPLSFLAMFLKT